jgi:hypothetical protein
VSRNDNKINIYDANVISGVDNIIQSEENNNLDNNNTEDNNINDNNNNIISGFVSEENINMKISPTLEASKSVDSYPLILRTDNSNHTENKAIPSIDTTTPMLRLRGGVGEEEKEGQNTEETGDRFILTR